MDDNSLDRLFSGDLDRLVSLPKRVVRLFISSTFTDMMLERNSLMERVYPQLKKYCREKHGLDFQVVDMRWGVRDEATDDHQTANLCSREIDNCQRLSLGPNFVALLGDKYGFRPLCNRINSAEYRALRRCLIEVDISTDLLDTWYKEDLNSLPPEYLLQPISSILRNFTNRNEPELQANDQQMWMAIQDRLHKLLVIGSSRLVQQGRMSEQEQLLKYSISVTEREVIEGCLDAINAKSCCLVYIRSITDLREHLSKCLTSLAASEEQLDPQSETLVEGVESIHLSDKPYPAHVDPQGVNTMAARMQKNFKAALRRRADKSRKLIGKYIDLTTGESSQQQQQIWRVDEEAQALLGQLREIKLDAKLKANGRSLTKYRIPWDEQEGLTLKREEHKQYVSEFTEHFYTNLTRMIKKAASKNEQELKSGLIGEVLQHSHYAKHASKSFHGRNDELELLRSYILSSHSSGVRPMFVYGVGGCGKTSVLAKAVCQAKSWILSAKSKQMGYLDERWDQQPCIIMRFCCATPSSSSLVGVLTSVCHQLQYNFYQFGPLNGATTNSSLMTNSAQEKRESSGDSEQPQLFYEPVAEDFVRLVFTFRQLLENCQHRLHNKRLFVIVIDSVERLTAPSESSLEAKHSWLTGLTNLPANVRLIVSCSSEFAGCNLATDYLYLKRHFLQLYLPVYMDSESDTRKASDETGCSPQRQESLQRLNSFCGSEISTIGGELGGSKRTRRSLARESVTQSMMKRLVLPAVRLRRASDLFRVTNTNVRSTAVNRPAEHNLEPIKSIDQAPPPISQASSPFASARDREDEDAGLLVKVPSIDLTAIAKKAAKSQVNVPKGVWLLHVRQMGVDLALGLLRRWLKESGRTLTQQQWALVRKSFASCSRPIFIKLAFGEIINWKSYSVQSDSKGLTFGSTLLDSLTTEPLTPVGDLAALNAKLETYLAALLRHHDSGFATLDSDGSDQLKRQTVGMEQQWLTYLDHSKQKEEEEQFKLNGISEGQQVLGGGSNLGEQKSRRSAQPLAATICHLSNSIDEAICQLFARIELQHGFVLTKHSLSYITAARNGICENELEDILSLDDVVLDDVFQYHLPPVRRIPPLLWTRIRNDLPDYLSERDADGIVLNWHHSQFEEVTKRRYLIDAKQQIYIHSTMADYFLGKWAHVAKPFRCARRQLLMTTTGGQQEGSLQLNSSVRSSGGSAGSTAPESSRQLSGATRFTSGGQPLPFSGRSSRVRSSDNTDASRRLLWVQAKADRRVPQQPLHYGSIETSQIAVESSAGERKDSDRGSGPKRRRYNLRKLIELPYHLMRSNRFQDLANEVLFNYNWLHATLDALGLQNLLADFREVSQSIDAALAARQSSLLAPDDLSAPSDKSIKSNNSSSELKLMRDQLLILANTIRLSSSSIHLDPQMLAPQLIGRLLPLVETRGWLAKKQSSAKGAAQGQQHSSPVGPSDGHLLAQLLDQCDRDGSAHCSLLPTGHCLQAPDGLQLSSLEGHSFAIMSMAMTASRRHLMAVSNRFIMWDIATGEVSRDINPQIGGSIIRQLRLSSNNEFAVAFTSANQLLVLDILTHQVAKYHFTNDYNSTVSANISSQVIRGLELVDKVRAGRFVVWTKDKWFSFCLEKTDGPTGSLSTSNNPQRVAIKLQYSCSLDELHLSSEYHSSEIVHADQVDGLKSDPLALITVAGRNDQNHTINSGAIRHKLMMLTVEISSQFKCWQVPDQWFACLAVESSRLRQLVYATPDGNLYLTRRRCSAWSKPKLIRRANEITDNAAKQSLVEQLDALVDESGSIVETKSNLTPIAIELESVFAGGSKLPLQSRHQSTDKLAPSIRELERFVDGEQATDREDGKTSAINSLTEHIAADNDINFASEENSSSTTIKLYLSTRIVVLRLGSPCGYIERNLVLPRDLRTISVQPNECQIKSVILEDISTRKVTGFSRQSLLVAAAGRRLLIYSLDSEQFLKQLEAHNGRIVQLLPIFSAPNDDSAKKNSISNLNISSKHGDRDNDDTTRAQTSVLCVASASMDKTVKVWNLANLNKEVHMLDKLDQALEYISLTASGQCPLAACLSRTEVGLWDWRTLKLLWRLEAFSLQRHPYGGGGDGGSRILKCRLSANGHYLCLSTKTALHLLTSTVDRADGWHRTAPPPSQTKICASYTQQSFVHHLPESSSCIDLRFFSQDSRLLSTIEYDKSANVASEHLTIKLVIWCHSIPDGQLLYKIDCTCPVVQTSADSRSLSIQQTQQTQAGRRRSLVANSIASSQQNGAASSGKNRLKPVLTRDQVNVVALVVSASTPSDRLVVDNRRQSSPLPVSLVVHSARDGLLLRSIDLARLETPRSSLASSLSESRRNQISKQQAGSQQAKLLATAEAATKLAQQQQQSGRQVPVTSTSLSGEQFTRLKAVLYRERQSIVALLDEDSGTSHLIDVHSRQLLASSTVWNGKLSKDGRYGLSRMFNSGNQQGASGNRGTLPLDGLATTGLSSLDGLQLLEMNRLSPIKSLLTYDTLGKLLSSSTSDAQSSNGTHRSTKAATASAAATGSQADIICGFAGLDDAYVYYHDSRLLRLLLFRVRDAQLVANYKLSTRATRIKLSPGDGQALILGLADGSLTTLAIVDPQNNDTLVRLAQYPSRRRKN